MPIAVVCFSFSFTLSPSLPVQSNYLNFIKLTGAVSVFLISAGTGGGEMLGKKKIWQNKCKYVLAVA